MDKFGEELLFGVDEDLLLLDGLLPLQLRLLQQLRLCLHIKKDNQMEETNLQREEKYGIDLLNRSSNSSQLYIYIWL